MFALRVVEHLDVVEDICPRVGACFVGFSPDAFALEEVEEAFGNGYRRSFASRLAHNTPRIQVNDNGQIGKAFIGFDVWDVSDPCRIRCSNIKLTIQGVIDSN